MPQGPSVTNPNAAPANDQQGSPSLDYSLVTSRYREPGSLSYAPSTEGLIERHLYALISCTGCNKEMRLIRLPCGKRSCSICGRVRHSRFFNRYLKLVEPAKDLKLLTLTTVAKGNLTRHSIGAIRSALQKLMHRRHFRDRVRGGIYAIEVKRGENGWNVHIHALIDASYLDQRAISSAWRDITRDSYVVDIRSTSPRGGLRYVLKHFLHPPSLNGQKHVYDRVLKGVRLVQTFGTFYRAKLPKLACPCPSCGGKAWVSVLKAPRTRMPRLA